MFHRKSDITTTNRAPDAVGIHIDLGRGDGLPREGAVLALADPADILKAARRSRGCPWIVWGIEAFPATERRAAAFVIAIARACRATTWVVVDRESGRAQRIEGHLRRSGAVAAPDPAHGSRQGPG